MLDQWMCVSPCFFKGSPWIPRPLKPTFSRIAACRCAKCLERMRISLRRIRSPKRRRVMLWESPSVASKQAMVGMKSHHWDLGGCLWMLNITGMGFMIYKRSKATCVIASITTIIFRLRVFKQETYGTVQFPKVAGDIMGFSRILAAYPQIDCSDVTRRSPKRTYMIEYVYVCIYIIMYRLMWIHDIHLTSFKSKYTLSISFNHLHIHDSHIIHIFIHALRCLSLLYPTSHYITSLTSHCIPCR